MICLLEEVFFDVIENGKTRARDNNKMIKKYLKRINKERVRA